MSTTTRFLTLLLAGLLLPAAAWAQDDVDNDGDGASEIGGDCDDTNPDIGPGADELCNGIDDDCDDFIDEDFDADGDGTGDCYDDDGDGATEEEGDCDDTDPTRGPTIPEACNGIDDNCDGEVDEGFDGTAAAYPPNGTSDCVDDDGDGFAEIEGDCDDLDAAIHSGRAEDCEDELDNDCDLAIDFEDHDCVIQAENESGIICECDRLRPEEARRGGAPGGVVLALLAVIGLGVRRARR